MLLQLLLAYPTNSPIHEQLNPTLPILEEFRGLPIPCKHSLNFRLPAVN